MSSNGDKRSVSTDALETLGTIIDESQKRDAIHLAVEPVVAGEDLAPGEHIMIDRGIAWRAARSRCLGIVDPFLKHGPKEGQHFWFVMYPRQVKSLRHVWSHPDFPDEPEKEKPLDPKLVQKIAKRLLIGDSEQWLREFCRTNDCPDYDRVLELAMNNTDPDFIHVSGSDAHGEIPDEFWDHVEAIIGREVPKEYRATGFSCSC